MNINRFLKFVEFTFWWTGVDVDVILVDSHHSQNCTEQLKFWVLWMGWKEFIQAQQKRKR